MTQLAANVNADAERWTLDSLPSTQYVQVDDETIEVRAMFPSSTYSLTGETLPPRIRVRRGIAGTTKASHLSGATLTPNYGLGSGGEGGAIAVTDGVTTVDPASSLTLPPGTVSDEGGGVASFTGGFIASAVDPGALGAGAVWKDITEGPGLDAVWWERNSTNDGWDAAAFARVVSTGDADADAGSQAEASGNGNAAAPNTATASGLGAADVRITAYGGPTGDGPANAGASAFAYGLGVADASLVATAGGDGDADVHTIATAGGAGNAVAGSIATATTGIGVGDFYAARQGVKAGMETVVDGTSARMAFNGTTPIAKPVVPLTTPDAQDVIDALVALGLIAQSD